MKKLLYRKLFKDYMSFFLIALLSSSLIIWVFQAVNFLDIMVEDGREYNVYISYSLLNLPKIITRLLPFVLFFSIFYVLSKYETNNELIIFWNFGENKLKFVNFILYISVFLLFIQISLSSFIVPKSQEKARSFLRDSNINFLGSFVKPKRFNDTIDGVTIYSESKDENGNLYNLYIKKDISAGFEITYAKKGIFKQFLDTPMLVLFNGETIRTKNNKITNFSFSKSDFSFKNLKSNTIITIKTQEMNTVDILSCIVSTYKINIKILSKNTKSIINCTKANLTNILKELYKRLFVPLYIPILMLLPYLIIFSSKEKRGYPRLKMITFFSGIVIIILSEGIIRLISEELKENFFIFLSPFLFFTLLYFLFFFKFNLRKL